MTAGYAERARHYAAEISHVPPPAALAGLLRPGLRVAEMPSGTGHFLTAYTAASATITLIDASPAMLTAARSHAEALGVTPRLLCSPIQDLTPQASPYGLIVIPNAALNQLAADTTLTELLAAAARTLEPGGALLAQVLAPDRDRACGFYDPALKDGTWHVDRELTDETGQPLTRHRRQRHGVDLIGIDFELHRGHDILHRHHVVLRPLTYAQLRAALANAGFTDTTISPGAGGLIELTAVRSRQHSSVRSWR